MGVQTSQSAHFKATVHSLLGVGSLDGGWETVRKSAKSSESELLRPIVLESKSLDGLGGVVNFFANLDFGVSLLGLGVLLSLLDQVVWLVGKSKGENSSEVILRLLTVSLHSNGVCRFASVVEASQVVCSMAPRKSLPLGNVAVVPLCKGPDNRIRLTHLPKRNRD